MTTPDPDGILPTRLHFVNHLTPRVRVERLREGIHSEGWLSTLLPSQPRPSLDAQEVLRASMADLSRKVAAFACRGCLHVGGVIAAGPELATSGTPEVLRLVAIVVCPTCSRGDAEAVGRAAQRRLAAIVSAKERP